MIISITLDISPSGLGWIGTSRCIWRRGDGPPRQGALGMDVRREKCLSQERIAQLQLQSSLLALLRKGRKGRLAEKEHSERGGLGSISTYFNQVLFFFHLFTSQPSSAPPRKPSENPENRCRGLKHRWPCGR